MDEVDQWSGGLTPEQKARMEEASRSIGQRRRAPGQPAAPATRAPAGGRAPSKRRDMVGETKSNPTVTFYAAGLGVMFLLFSAAGAGGALIEEAESGTLDRILSTRVDMTRCSSGSSSTWPASASCSSLSCSCGARSSSASTSRATGRASSS